MCQWIYNHCFRWLCGANQATSHYLNQCWNIVNMTLRNKSQWNINRDSHIFIQENAFENVICKMSAIVSRPHCVKLDLCSIMIDMCFWFMVCKSFCANLHYTFQKRCYDLRHINTLRPRQNGCHFADDIFKCIFLNKNVWIPIKISLKFVPKGPINNIPALVQIMAWRRPGYKLLSEPMMVSLPTHICVTRPQWVKCIQHDRLLEHNEADITV